MKKYGADSKDAKGGSAFGSNNSSYKNSSQQGIKDKYSDSKNSSLKNTAGAKQDKYSTTTKYSSQSGTGGSAKQDKYSTETKYSASKGGTSETTKYSSQSKYSTGSSGLERRASYKSVERWDNEKNAARERDRALAKDKYSSTDSKYSAKDKYSSTDNKYSATDNKYSAKADKYSTKDTSKDDKYKSQAQIGWGKDKEDTKPKQYSFSSSAATKDTAWSKDKNDTKSKYSLSTKTETKGDYKSSSTSSWCTKAFSSADPRYAEQSTRAFSSQTASSTWDDRNRGRAFPYDRDHELRRSLNKYDADTKNLDPKYRKPGLVTNGAGLAAGGLLGAAVGPVSGASSGRTAEATRLRDDRGLGAATTGCHNCALQ
ncbi:Glycine-rich RNA-binding protein RZ1A [Frankliniella fusca]|uniref:Glycine-rich RNA-binding protein RZ1A n=1 Tax=Frankliniella fusca TaxID=407009 RepID=A0AAE1HCJ8_9NEOP|nr:Glycine-rich RNA-binding protein RZ1A [Frankliniella fusca]